MSTNSRLPKPIYILPVCCHTVNKLEQIIKCIIDKFYKYNSNAHIVEIATDGDTFRRKILNSMRTFQIGFDEFYEMKYFDNRFVHGKIGLNFDFKHLIKRLRGILIAEKRSITLIKHAINKSSIQLFLPHLSTLLNPFDYQNVPFAVKLLKGLKDISNSTIVINDLSVEIKKEIELLSILSEKLLLVFIKPKISLMDQLIALSTASFLLFYIYRKWKTQFMTNDLYKDIQCIFLIALRYSKLEPNTNLYLFQLGTDGLELLFSHIRTINHAPNCDILELLERIKIALQIQSVYADHPLWHRKSRLNFSSSNKMNKNKEKDTEDHSSILDWTGKLDTNDIDIKSIWRLGETSATELLLRLGYMSTDLSIINDENVTMINPFGKDLVIDEEPNLQDLLIANENDMDEDVSIPEFTDEIPSPFTKTVEFNGDTVYKSSLINKLINCNDKLSKDRVKRVQGLRSDCFSLAETHEPIFDCSYVYITDLMSTIVQEINSNKLVLIILIVDKILINNENMYSILSTEIKNCRIEGKILKLIYENNNLVWNGDYDASIKNIDGNLCLPIKVSFKKLDELVFTFPPRELIDIKRYFETIIDSFLTINVQSLKLHLSLDYLKEYSFIKKNNSSVLSKIIIPILQMF